MEDEEFTTQSLSETILRARSVIDFSDDPEAQLEMAVLDSYIRYLDLTDFTWRERLVKMLNDKGVKVHSPHLISFNTKSMIAMIEDVPVDLKQFIKEGQKEK
jgi:hypothetical protein